MKFLVLGATGMAGHTITLYLKEQDHDVTAVSRTNFQHCTNIIGDIMDISFLSNLLNRNSFDAVINCIGILNNEAEIKKHQAVFVNSFLPHFLSQLASGTNTKIIHMSTDCVFSGSKGNYMENSFRDGVTFYDRSKALGELENEKDLTFRNSIIGPDMKSNGIGLFNWFMRQNCEIYGYKKAIWTGVTTLTLAKAIEKATKDNLVGLYNLVNNEAISKYELLRMFNKFFKNNKTVIHESNNLSVNKSLVNNRTDFNFTVPSYEEMMIEMKEWIEKHRELYPHYFHE